MSKTFTIVNGDMSDSSHTFDELYEHRNVLWVALCAAYASETSVSVWRSKVHSDGGGYPGWFLLGMFREAGNQITYHLPDSLWDRTNFAETLERAPEWDGHTSADVLERLRTL